jgi:hypothetical protein
MNSRFNSVSDSFARIPEPHASRRGFGQPVPIGNATEMDEAVSASQLVGSTLIYSADTGTAGNYVVTLPIAPIAYATGLTVCFAAQSNSTNATTVNVNSLGIKQVRRYNGDQLVAGEIVVGQIVTLIYSPSGYFQVLSETKGSASISEDNAAASEAAAAASAAEALASKELAFDYKNEAFEYRNDAGFYALHVDVSYARFLKYSW